MVLHVAAELAVEATGRAVLQRSGAAHHKRLPALVLLVQHAASVLGQRHEADIICSLNSGIPLTNFYSGAPVANLCSYN